MVHGEVLIFRYLLHKLSINLWPFHIRHHNSFFGDFSSFRNLSSVADSTVAHVRPFAWFSCTRISFTGDALREIFPFLRRNIDGCSLLAVFVRDIWLSFNSHFQAVVNLWAGHPTWIAHLEFLVLWMRGLQIFHWTLHDRTSAVVNLVSSAFLPFCVFHFLAHVRFCDSFSAPTSTPPPPPPRALRNFRRHRRVLPTISFWPNLRLFRVFRRRHYLGTTHTHTHTHAAEPRPGGGAAARPVTRETADRISAGYSNEIRKAKRETKTIGPTNKRDEGEREREKTKN